jgi:hypothetical protein
MGHTARTTVGKRALKTLYSRGRYHSHPIAVPRHEQLNTRSLLTQELLQRPRRLALHLWEDVGVQIQRDADGRVTEHLRDDLGRYTRAELESIGRHPFIVAFLYRLKAAIDRAAQLPAAMQDELATLLEEALVCMAQQGPHASPEWRASAERAIREQTETLEYLKDQ